MAYIIYFKDVTRKKILDTQIHYQLINTVRLLPNTTQDQVVSPKQVIKREMEIMVCWKGKIQHTCWHFFNNYTKVIPCMHRAYLVCSQGDLHDFQPSPASVVTVYTSTS